LHAEYLLDALKTIPDAQAVLDAEPIVSPNCGERVWPRASSAYCTGGRRVRWVVMQFAVESGHLDGPARRLSGGIYDSIHEQQE
jgi:hypothetical protein